MKENKKLHEIINKNHQIVYDNPVVDRKTLTTPENNNNAEGGI
jgi:hypothetical protein